MLKDGKPADVVRDPPSRSNSIVEYGLEQLAAEAIARKISSCAHGL